MVSKPGGWMRTAAARRTGRYTLLACLALASVSCASNNLAPASVAEVNGMVDAEYRLSPGDRIRVTVFDEPSLTGEYEVGAAGTATLPLIADVPAAGETPQSVANAITAKLQKGGFVVTPKVAVDVLSRRPIYVLGEVNKPGEYPYQSGLTFYQAIAKAGGFTVRANQRSIVLQRKTWNSGRTVKLHDNLLAIAPGDTIIIREAFF